MLICKFQCVEKTENVDGSFVKMQTVTHGSKENDVFFKYTPCGELRFGTINNEASKELIVNKEYYITISEQPIVNIGSRIQVNFGEDSKIIGNKEIGIITSIQLINGEKYYYAELDNGLLYKNMCDGGLGIAGIQFKDGQYELI